jgi:netrin-G3 ligand
VSVPNESPYTVGRTVISSLQPFTSYEVSVAAVSLGGSGPYSDPVAFMTEEDVPGEPRKFKVDILNSTAVSVQWRPPADRDHNGIIRGYMIRYVTVIDVDEPVGDHSVIDVPDASRTEATVGGLQPETSYHFQVSAYTRKGEGEYTRPKKVRTRGAVPSAPRGLQLSLTQTDPPIVSLSWTPPRQTYGNIDGYKLTYGIRGDSSIEERRIDADKFRFTTGFLERGADYEFRLSAKNGIDYGDAALEVIRTPDGIPSGAPQNFTAIGVGPTSLRLQWDPPAKRHRNGEIILYEIIYHQRTNPLEDFMTNSSDVTTMVEGLEVNTDYIFQLRAYTSKGSGPWSNKLPFRTFGSYGFPAPTNVQLRRTSATAIDVSWDAPSYQGVIGYRVYYHTSAVADMDRWQSQEISGPFTVTEISGLEPHSVYAVRVRARGADGRYGNYSDIVVANRLESEHPDSVQMFEGKIQNPRTVLLEWKPPRTPGVFRYKVDYVGIKKYHDPMSGLEETLIDPQKSLMVSKEDKNLVINDLAPKTMYSFNISAKFIDGSWGPPYGIQVETSSDAPPDIEPPTALRTVADGTVLLRLMPALGLSVAQYYIVVVPDELARQKKSSGLPA